MRVEGKRAPSSENGITSQEVSTNNYGLSVGDTVKVLADKDIVPFGNGAVTAKITGNHTHYFSGETLSNSIKITISKVDLFIGSVKVWRI